MGDPGPTTSPLSYLKRSADCGDSGGPTYALRSEGRALAAAITEGSIKMSFLGFGAYYRCYVTIDDALGVGSYTLATGK